MARMVPLSLAGFALISAAQEDGRVRGSSFRDLPICQSEGDASRVRTKCDSEAQSAKEITRSIERPALRPQCQARVDTEYLQVDQMVRVEGRIQVRGCEAAMGEYTISARIMDRAGARDTLEFDAAWQRDDGLVTTFAADYPIGRDVELLNLRVRRVSCTCVEQTDALDDAP